MKILLFLVQNSVSQIQAWWFQVPLDVSSIVANVFNMMAVTAQV